MGLLGELLSLPTKIAGGVLETAGEITGLEDVTGIVTKPLGKIIDTLEEIDEYED